MATSNDRLSLPFSENLILLSGLSNTDLPSDETPENEDLSYLEWWEENLEWEEYIPQFDD